jgi:uncharacterized protein YbaP (TraB family)
MNKMKKIFFILTLVFFACTAFAQSSNEKTGALLWKISGNGLKQPSYIFGTHHHFPFSFLDSIAGVKQAFASSEQMVGELVLSDMAALEGEMQKAGMMPQDTTWQMLLSEDDYRFVDEQLTAVFGVGLQSFGRLKPSMVNTAYNVSFYQKIFPQVNMNEIFDLWFQQQAVDRGIPVVGLETAQDQIEAIFEFSSLKQQAADLVNVMKHADDIEIAANKLNFLYRSADLNGLYEIINEQEETPYPVNAEQAVAINETRNKRWLEKLPAIMADKPSFIAVGCLHLIGEVGLLVGLEKAGYTVEAVHEL